MGRIWIIHWKVIIPYLSIYLSNNYRSLSLLNSTDIINHPSSSSSSLLLTVKYWNTQLMYCVWLTVPMERSYVLLLLMVLYNFGIPLTGISRFISIQFNIYLLFGIRYLIPLIANSHFVCTPYFHMIIIIIMNSILTGTIEGRRDISRGRKLTDVRTAKTAAGKFFST